MTEKATVKAITSKGNVKELSKEQYKTSDYFHAHYRLKWYAPLGAEIDKALNTMVKSAARVSPQSISFQKLNGKSISFLGMEADDLIDISASLGQVLNNNVKRQLFMSGASTIRENLDALNNSDKSQRIAKLNAFFDGIEDTLKYIDAFKASSDKKVWEIFRREIIKYLADGQKTTGADNKPFILSEKHFETVNSTLATVMRKLSKLPKNVADKENGVYNRESLRSFMQNIIATEIGELGAGQYLQEIIEQQTKQAMTTLSRSGNNLVVSEISNKKVSQKADATIRLCSSNPYSLTLKSTRNQTGFNLILEGKIGLSVKEYGSSSNEIASDGFVKIHSGGSYVKALKNMFGGLSYTAIGNTLGFSNNQASGERFRALRSAFIGRYLETALIGGKSGSADIIAINGKYYLTSVLYSAAIANIRLNTDYKKSWNESKDNGVNLRFNTPFSSNRAKWVRQTKGLSKIDAALKRSGQDRINMYEMTYYFEINPKRLIEKWLPRV